MVVPEAIAAQGKYMRALLNRVNPYDHTRYKKNPAIALIEPINEPAYVTRENLAELPRVRQVYDAWLARQGRTEDDAAFGAFRYQSALAYINGMVGLLREEGVNQPVVWNCGWPRNIRGNKEIFEAIADSRADVVSFCLYPGQDDLKVPYWDNREDLSGRNYFPYLKNVSDHEDWMGWIRGPRFASKAKVVYEFETFCNQSAYLFPAMAKEFRSLGAQVATLWTYALSGYAPYCAGSHVFNLETTPRKAAAFMVADEVFKALPRGVPYQTTTPGSDQYEGFALSQPLDISAASVNGTFIHAGTPPDGFIAPPENPQRIIGTGNSPFITYDGTGLRFLQRQSEGIYLLTILPHAKFVAPHWQGAKTGPTVELDRKTAYPLKLNCPEIQRSPGSNARSARHGSPCLSTMMNSLLVQENTGSRLSDHEASVPALYRLLRRLILYGQRRKHLLAACFGGIHHRGLRIEIRRVTNSIEA